ncbi:MAG: class I adenylate-forming enzyme family protein, partial [Kibdelosporangium sp.]
AEHADVKSRQLLETLHPRPRPRVAIIRRNSPAYVTDFLAVLKAGGVPFLMDPALGAGEIATLRETCGLDAILHDGTARLPMGGMVTVCGGTRLWVADEDDDESAVELHPETEVCRLTSGSTRSPACIEFAGSAILAAARSWRAASELAADDRILCFAGLYNGLAFNTSLVPGLLSGADLFLPAGLPSPGNVARHLNELEPTVLVAFPAAYDAMAASADRAARHRLRLSLSSAARLSADTSRTLADRSIRIADYYGIAETGPLTFDARPVPGGGQGYPLPGVSLRADEAGVLQARSRSMGTRYLNYPGELESRITADGYYRTSDRGSLSGDGELRLAGRVGRSLAIGGRKFAAEEVENLLRSHPDVEAGVAAVVTPAGGRPVLGAVVVPRGELDLLELRRYCLARTAAFKVPERVVFADALPVNGAGKVQAAKVADLLLRNHERLG